MLYVLNCRYHKVLSLIPEQPEIHLQLFEVYDILTCKCFGLKLSVKCEVKQNKELFVKL